MTERPQDWNERYVDGNTPWDTGKPSSELQRVLAEYEIAPCPALELGCGTGTNAIYLAQQGFTVTATDIASLAIDQAREKAAAAGVEMTLHAADLLDLPALDGPFGFLFDRGVYHALRRENLDGYLDTVATHLAPGGMYLTIAGNANEPREPDQPGPPQVAADEICAELGRIMELVQLREMRFDEVDFGTKRGRPLGWSALFRRK